METTEQQPNEANIGINKIKQEYTENEDIYEYPFTNIFIKPEDYDIEHENEKIITNIELNTINPQLITNVGVNTANELITVNEGVIKQEMNQIDEIKTETDGIKVEIEIDAPKQSISSTDKLLEVMEFENKDLVQNAAENCSNIDLENVKSEAMNNLEFPCPQFNLKQGLIKDTQSEGQPKRRKKKKKKVQQFIENQNYEYTEKKKPSRPENHDTTYIRDFFVRYQCPDPECPLSFRVKMLLDIHKSNCHGKKSKRQDAFCCKLCSKEYATSHLLRIHKMLKHSQKGKQKTYNSVGNVYKSTSLKNKAINTSSNLAKNKKKEVINKNGDDLKHIDDENSETIKVNKDHSNKQREKFRRKTDNSKKHKKKPNGKYSERTNLENKKKPKVEYDSYDDEKDALSNSEGSEVTMNINNDDSRTKLDNKKKPKVENDSYNDEKKVLSKSKGSKVTKNFKRKRKVKYTVDDEEVDDNHSSNDESSTSSEDLKALKTRNHLKNSKKKLKVKHNLDDDEEFDDSQDDNYASNDESSTSSED